MKTKLYFNLFLSIGLFFIFNFKLYSVITSKPIDIKDSKTGYFIDSLEIAFYPCDCYPVHYAFEAICESSINQYYWDFGDGAHSTTANPTHQYNIGGEYTICLVVLLENGDSLFKCATSYMEPAYPSGCQAFFTYGLAYCGQNCYAFSNESTGENLSYFWNFGDQSTSSEKNPSHIYTSEGPYNVCLSVYSPDSCIDRYCDTIFIENPTVNCSAEFSYHLDLTVNCINCIQFIDNSSGNIITWDWDFGDSTYSSEQNPYHSYQDYGTYGVKLKIVTSDSCTSFVYKTVYVGEPEPCNISIRYGVLESFPVQYEFSYDTMTNLHSSFKWEINDGTVAYGPTLRHTFIESGTYSVCLTVYNIFGDSCHICLTEYFEGIYDENECYLKGTVKDYSELDGCGYLIQLDNGKLIEPVFGPFEDFGMFFYDGQRVKINYTPIRLATSCMAGIVAQIDCIEEIENDTINPGNKFIKSIQVTPENPVSNEEVSILVNSVFPSGDCNLISKHIRKDGNNIYILATYNLGEALYICSSSDTIPLGSFDAGKYKLYYQVVVGEYTSAIKEIVELDFTVADINFGMAGPDQTICPGDSAYIGLQILTCDIYLLPGSYYWEPSTGLSDPEAPITMASPEQTTTYYLYTKYNPDSNFVFTDSVTVYVTRPYFEFEKVVFPCIVPPCPEEYIFYDKSEGFGLSREWSFGFDYSTGEKTPGVMFPDSGIYEVCLTTTTEYGCEQKYCRNIYVNTGGNIQNDCDGHIVLTTSTIIGNDACNATASAGLIDSYGNELEIKKYQWSTGKTSNEIKGLCPNVFYALTITDKNECEYYASFSFAELFPDELTFIMINYQLIEGNYYCHIPLNGINHDIIWSYGDSSIAYGSSVIIPQNKKLTEVTVKIVNGQGDILFEQILELPGYATDIAKNNLGKEISVFPNPSNCVIYLQVTNEFSENNYLEIFNTTGQLIKSIQINNSENQISLDISTLRQGIYFGYLMKGNKTYQFKFIKTE